MGSSPKVLFVIHQIGSGADGGIRSIAELIRSVPSLDKLIVTNIESAVTDSLRKAGPLEIWSMAEVTYSGRRSKLLYRGKQLLARLRNNWSAFKAIRRLNADIVHANDLRSFWNTIIGAKFAGAKVILNVRDTMRSGGNIRQWKLALRLCDSFLVLSNEMVEMWRRDLSPVSGHRHHRDKFAFIYSIVDRSRYSPIDDEARMALRARLGIEKGRPALVYVGRFEEKKAQLPFIDRMLSAFAQIRPDALTYFIGDFDPARDAYAAACEQAVQRLGLAEKIRFVGYTANPEDWYRAADIVVLASGREGLPRCMLETLACGGVFATLDVSSTREILERHHCGVVIPQGGYVELAQVCADLLGDPSRMARFRARGPSVVAELFDSTVNGKAYLSLLPDIVGSPAEPAPIVR